MNPAHNIRGILEGLILINPKYAKLKEEADIAEERIKAIVREARIDEVERVFRYCERRKASYTVKEQAQTRLKYLKFGRKDRLAQLQGKEQVNV